MSGDRTSELGEYLRARRAAVAPEEVGLPRGRRRVRGLRREEVAALGGVSVDYYRRLEQGRERHPSDQVLDALGAALRLDAEEHAHLLRIADRRRARPGAAPVRQVSPALRALLDQWPATPAYVVDDVQQILAENALGAALHSGFAHRDNFSRMIFLDPAGPRFFADWGRIATANAAVLRQTWGQTWGRPGSRVRIASLVDELRAGSAEFDRIWRSHAVTGKTGESKRLVHPDIGALTLTYHAFALAEADGHLLVCQAEPGSRDEDGLRLLSSLIGSRA